MLLYRSPWSVCLFVFLHSHTYNVLTAVCPGKPRLTGFPLDNLTRGFSCKVLRDGCPSSQHKYDSLGFICFASIMTPDVGKGVTQPFASSHHCLSVQINKKTWRSNSVHIWNPDGVQLLGPKIQRWSFRTRNWMATSYAFWTTVCYLFIY